MTRARPRAGLDRLDLLTHFRAFAQDRYQSRHMPDKLARMDKEEFEDLFVRIKLTGAVRVRVEATCMKPEGDIEARWVHKLLTHYMYAPEQIACGVSAGAGRNAATSPVKADIVVYRDKERKEPFIVVEVKKPDENSVRGIKQSGQEKRDNPDFPVNS